MIDLTIITPTYNRADFLDRCFASLCAQSCYDFEWIVVNDGSTDHTDSVMQKITSSAAPFPIQYIQKKNGGKHTALNAAHPYIHGKYVLILDSDDRLTDDAVEQALLAWKRWEHDSAVGIVTLLKGRDQAHPNCYAADENVPVDVISYARICPVSNDACEVIRADLFRKYPFPVFPGEKFLSEGALWGRVGMTHQCVYVNRVIYLCDYLEDGLTKAGKAMRIRNPRGGMFHANIYMTSKSTMKTRVKNGLLYTCYGYFAGMRPKDMRQGCDHKLLMSFCLPFGRLMFYIWKKRYGG